MSYYAKNRLRARTINTEPTLTEQSMARDTDINIIVQKFRITGRVPGTQQQPMAGDFTNLPTDLRGFIETAKSIKDVRKQLPPQLREMPIEELLSLTPDKLTSILTPDTPTTTTTTATKNAPPPNEPKP